MKDCGTSGGGAVTGVDIWHSLKLKSTGTGEATRQVPRLTYCVIMVSKANLCLTGDRAKVTALALHSELVMTTAAATGHMPVASQSGYGKGTPGIPRTSPSTATPASPKGRPSLGLSHRTPRRARAAGIHPQVPGWSPPLSPQAAPSRLFPLRVCLNRWESAGPTARPPPEVPPGSAAAPSSGKRALAQPGC